MFGYRKHFIIEKKGNFFQVLYHLLEAGFPPHSHTSVMGASWGCFLPFSILCFGGRRKPKFNGMILEAGKDREGQVNGEGRRGASWKWK